MLDVSIFGHVRGGRVVLLGTDQPVQRIALPRCLQRRLPTPPQDVGNGRARISAAQRARWAKVKERQAGPKPGRRTMSASARQKIAAAQRASWAKVKRGKKAAEGDETSYTITG